MKYLPFFFFLSCSCTIIKTEKLFPSEVVAKQTWESFVFELKNTKDSQIGKNISDTVSCPSCFEHHIRKKEMVTNLNLSNSKDFKTKQLIKKVLKNDFIKLNLPIYIDDLTFDKMHSSDSYSLIDQSKDKSFNMFEVYVVRFEGEGIPNSAYSFHFKWVGNMYQLSAFHTYP